MDFPKIEGLSEGGKGEELQARGYMPTRLNRCYNCGMMGHISYDCTQPQVRKACYHCGNTGHMAREWYMFIHLVLEI